MLILSRKIVKSVQKYELHFCRSLAHRALAEYAAGNLEMTEERAFNLLAIRIAQEAAEKTYDFIAKAAVWCQVLMNAVQS
jgi:hypothetical protein